MFINILLESLENTLNITSYTEILESSDVALAVKTDGRRFEFINGGESSTGCWPLDLSRQFNKVIVYHSGQGGNIYIGDYVSSVEDAELTGKYHINLNNTRLVGNTSESWTQFTHGKNPGYSRIYLEGGNFVSPPLGTRTPRKTTQTVDVFERDEQVKIWILSNANGECESCGKEPFNNIDGQPYLEVHHVKRLADGGSDTTTNTVALCADCHRELHYGENRELKQEKLYLEIARLIRE